MPTAKQRLDVWNGLRKRTSGGLTKSMLIKNKRGKIVSKKKSEQAALQNNLGDKLRPVGKKMKKGEQELDVEITDFLEGRFEFARRVNVR